MTKLKSVTAVRMWDWQNMDFQNPLRTLWGVDFMNLKNVGQGLIDPDLNVVC